MGGGYAAAHIAIDNNDLECLKLCLRLGADSEVRNFKSETPQQLAYLVHGCDKDCRMVSKTLLLQVENNVHQIVEALGSLQVIKSAKLVFFYR